ncbi:hypothetical protein [Sulfurimonas sp. HSL3-7]|uniref:hypothetical protein n=1 Tax=Sulfonitrofixus jiaomeiensis TaxID=3131938 RepID=UPI0031F7F377
MRIVVLLFLFFSSIKATTLDEQLTQDAYLATVNAAIVFTSQDGLSSGVYRFTKIDTQMRMYNLPLSYQFDPLTENTNLFVLFDLGYSDTRKAGNVLDENGTFLHLNNRMQTYVGGIGVGIRYRATAHSDLSFGGELLYSRVGLTVRPEEDLDGSSIENFFSDDFNDNFSYKLFAEYDYHREYRGYEIYMKLNYKLYKTLSKFDLTDLAEDIIGDITSLRSQTSVASLIMGFETDPLYNYRDMSLTLEPYLKGNYIWGDLAEVAKMGSYATAGVSIYWNTPEKRAYIYRYFVEPSVSRGEGLAGLNLSLGFSLDF